MNKQGLNLAKVKECVYLHVYLWAVVGFAHHRHTQIVANKNIPLTQAPETMNC